jgi:hypothetical protein
MTHIAQDGQHYSSEEEELEVITAGTALIAREQRNLLLSQSDWIVVKSQEEGTTVPTPLVEYRNALRNLPSAEGWPLTFEYPTKPS